MSDGVRLGSLAAVGLGLIALGTGVIYLCVAYQSLPEFMGPVHGDSSPRTGLGIFVRGGGVRDQPGVNNRS